MLCFLPSMHQCIDLQSRCGLMEAYERARQEARGGIRSPIGSNDTRATAVIKINTSESERYTFSIRRIKGGEKQSASVFYPRDSASEGEFPFHPPQLPFNVRIINTNTNGLHHCYAPTGADEKLTPHLPPRFLVFFVVLLQRVNKKRSERRGSEGTLIVTESDNERASCKL